MKRYFLLDIELPKNSSENDVKYIINHIDKSQLIIWDYTRNANRTEIAIYKDLSIISSHNTKTNIIKLRSLERILS